MDELLTTKEASEYLKVHRRTLYRMMKDGRLPFEYIAGSHRIRIRKAHLGALLVPGGASGAGSSGEGQERIAGS